MDTWTEAVISAAPEPVQAGARKHQHLVAAHSLHRDEADRCHRIATRISDIRTRLNEEWWPLLDRHWLWPLIRSRAERRNRARFRALGKAFDANSTPWQNHLDAMMACTDGMRDAADEMDAGWALALREGREVS